MTKTKQIQKATKHAIFKDTVLYTCNKHVPSRSTQPSTLCGMVKINISFCAE